MLSGKQKRLLAVAVVSSLFILLSVAIVEQILQAEQGKYVNQVHSNVNLQLMTAGLPHECLIFKHSAAETSF